MEKENGKGFEYYNNGQLKFEGEYLNGKKMEKEKNTTTTINQNLKGIIWMEKEMEKEKNIIILIN